MRHFYKSHGKHCFLRSFQTVCKKCSADVLYWECTHGSKMFFEYPPYGKLIRHNCRKHQGLLRGKKGSPIVVKTPKGLLGEPYCSCAVCGKRFKDESSLDDHFRARGKNDFEHKMCSNNKLRGKNLNWTAINSYVDRDTARCKPKFGRINIKTSKDE